MIPSLFGEDKKVIISGGLWLATVVSTASRRHDSTLICSPLFLPFFFYLSLWISANVSTEITRRYTPNHSNAVTWLSREPRLIKSKLWYRADIKYEGRSGKKHRSSWRMNFLDNGYGAWLRQTVLESFSLSRFPVAVTFITVRRLCHFRTWPRHYHKPCKFEDCAFLFRRLFIFTLCASSPLHKV